MWAEGNAAAVAARMEDEAVVQAVVRSSSAVSG